MKYRNYFLSTNQSPATAAEGEGQQQLKSHRIISQTQINHFLKSISRIEIKILSSSENHEVAEFSVNLDSKKIKKSWWKWKPWSKERNVLFMEVGRIFRENVVCLFSRLHHRARLFSGFKSLYQLFKNLPKDYHKYIIKCTQKEASH